MFIVKSLFLLSALMLAGCNSKLSYYVIKTNFGKTTEEGISRVHTGISIEHRFDVK